MNVKSLIIVGGGSSAWLTAAYLSYNNPEIDLTVIDKKHGEPVGVGEATLLHFGPFMEECGFEFHDWISAIDAGYKTGILFKNWQEQNKDIWHPFNKGRFDLINGISNWDIWTNNQDLDFQKYILSDLDSSKKNKVDIENSNGFQIDCGLLTRYIIKKLSSKVKFIESEVVDIKYDQKDNIEHITLENGDVLSSDLFVDTTGWSNVLRKNVDKVNLSDRLFVNTAVAGHVPYQNKQEEFKPYTVCETTDHGWVWQIAINSRIGTGMLFDRNLTDENEAKQYFCNYWNHRINPENLRVLKWDPFYLKDPWKGNVVCIGLSSGFIEPLESTGVGTAIIAATRLSNVLKERSFQQYDIDQYNAQLVTLFEDAADFVAAHYAANKKQSKFWNHVRNKFVPSEKMNLILADFENPYIPVHYDGNLFRFFNGVGWTLLMLQLGYNMKPKSINVDHEIARYKLIQHYVESKKYKWNKTRHHLEEISMLNEIANFKK